MTTLNIFRWLPGMFARAVLAVCAMFNSQLWGQQDSVAVKEYTYEVMELMRTNAFKFAPLGPITGSLSLGFETRIKNDLTFNLQAAFVRTNREFFDGNIRGGYTAIGVKQVLGLAKSRENSHMWDGFFVMPQLALSLLTSVRVNTFPNPMDYKRTGLYGGLFFNFGYQGVIKNRVLVELYGGFGYGAFVSQNRAEGQPRYRVVGNTEPGYYFSHAAILLGQARGCLNIGWMF